MHYRSLGRTGLVVSEIGFGAWGIGGRTVSQTSYGDTDDRTSLAALARAHDCGITFFDTSAVYGNGHSEELIGKALSGVRHKAVLATKAGYEAWDRPPDFSAAAIVASAFCRARSRAIRSSRPATIGWAGRVPNSPIGSTAREICSKRYWPRRDCRACRPHCASAWRFRRS